ncbi:hypothetical protein SISSUDRAFT_224034 [Sistotremastrum suecicum HHB10207 ss-3]|uniref:Uncharacterized protein n=1 Tax=Sistotremastrum suecicum HHB10207 ss-3 TaxID=1314776 RepID=A0A166A2X1_9AGAM|nr:hypothetical protein SISSUDRAFT_224034 [Sistotremastrum suecicum HHB10207 ss-3]
MPLATFTMRRPKILPHWWKLGQFAQSHSCLLELTSMFVCFFAARLVRGGKSRHLSLFLMTLRLVRRLLRLENSGMIVGTVVKGKMFS